MGKLNSQILEGPRCFGPHHLSLRGSMGDFKVFFGPFSNFKLLDQFWAYQGAVTSWVSLIDIVPALAFLQRDSAQRQGDSP